jgi:hypothetical protein
MTTGVAICVMSLCLTKHRPMKMYWGGYIHYCLKNWVSPRTGTDVVAKNGILAPVGNRTAVLQSVDSSWHFPIVRTPWKLGHMPLFYEKFLLIRTHTHTHTHTHTNICIYIQMSNVLSTSTLGGDTIRGSSVSLVTKQREGWPGFYSRHSQGAFFFPQDGSRTHPAP